MAENAVDVFKRWMEAPDEQKAEVYAESREALTKTQFKKLQNLIKEAAEKAEAEDTEGFTNVATPEASTAPPNPRKGKEKEEVAAVQDAEVERFWAELDGMDALSLIDEQVIKDFQYVGFNPNEVLRSILSMGKQAKKTPDQIKKDIATMATMAIMKGSITDHNLKKMSDEGKRTYQIYETTYGLRRGGSKNVDPKVVTIARVGAAFPGAIMSILLQKGNLAKQFTGPFGSKSLPAYLRHQAAAACIPETLAEPVKSYLLGLVIAHTADQTKNLSKSKDKPEELYERQENFVNQTHSSSYPTEPVRKQIFKQMSLIADFEKLKVVSDRIRVIKTDFPAITRDDLSKAVALM